jgi:3-oxoadipate enol-lactonase
MQKSSFKTSDSTNIYYETHGFESSGPAVVFLNGTMQTTFNWRPHARVFKDSFRVILYDARAQGKSELGKKKLSLDLHVKDLSELLLHLKIKKAHLVGLSHGAYVALAFASRLPDFVSRLVLCSINAEKSVQTKIMVKSWLGILKSEGLDALAWTVLPMVFGKEFLNANKRILDKMVEAIVVRNNKDALIAQLKAINKYPSPGFLANKISCPALVISGSQDQLVNPKEAKQLADLCRARHEEFSGMGHSVPAETPELFNKIVLKFLTPS